MQCRHERADLLNAANAGFTAYQGAFCLAHSTVNIGALAIASVSELEGETFLESQLLLAGKAGGSRPACRT